MSPPLPTTRWGSLRAQASPVPRGAASNRSLLVDARYAALAFDRATYSRSIRPSLSARVDAVAHACSSPSGSWRAIDSFRATRGR
jgi:hypothetical protein